MARYAQHPQGVCLSRLALTQLFRGRRAEVGPTMREALRVATELDDPMTAGYVDAAVALDAPWLHERAPAALGGLGPGP